jgi:hypothetical protein
MGREEIRTTQQRANVGREPSPAVPTARPQGRLDRITLQDALGNLGTARYAGALRRKAMDGGRPPVPEDGRADVITEIADAGFGGRSHRLPYLEQIQASFGRHDIGDVDAHVGGMAAKAGDVLGAHAYTRGEQVAFRESPDIHTAAHEAAHVVQQRQGGVLLSGPVGHADDRFERHADAVADLVVRGASAESLLGLPASGRNGPTAGAIQLDRDEDADVVPFSKINLLPSREKYEAKGQLKPLGSAPSIDLDDFTVKVSSTGGAWSLGARKVQDKPPDLSALNHPQPIAETVGEDAATMSSPEMLMRLAALEVLASKIARLVAGNGYQEGLAEGAAGIIGVVSSRLKTPPGVESYFVDPYGVLDPIPTEPAPLSREIVRSETVFDRVAGGIAEVAADRAREEQMGGSIAATSASREGAHYDVEEGLSGLRNVQRWYVEAANHVLQPRIVGDFNYADRLHGETNDGLQKRKLIYFETLKSNVAGGERLTGPINDWAHDVEQDLAWLDEQAPKVRAARESNSPDFSLEQEFEARAGLVGASIEALSEYDRAAVTYDVLKVHAFLGFGLEDAKRIRWRLEQMHRAAQDRDVDYLRVLLRDHQKDSNVQAFYARVPDIVKWSGIIRSLTIMLIATLASAGVGIAITAVTGVTAGAVELLSLNFFLRLGLQSFTFTLVSRSLQSLTTGVTVGSFWAEFLSNLVLFGAMGAASIGLRSTLKALGSIAASAVSHSVNLSIMQVYGYIHGSIEAGHLLTGDEVAEMTQQNLLMMVAMGVLMKPFEPIIHGLEKTAATNHFLDKYQGEFAEIETSRNQLAKAIEARIGNDPSGEKSSAEVNGFREKYAEIEGRLKLLVDRAIADPRCDTVAMRREIAEMVTRAQRTPLPEVLHEGGLDPAMEVMPTGREGSWSFPQGRGEALKAFLVKAGYEIALDIPTSGGRVIEAEVPGKGRVQLIERPTAERVVVPLSEGELAAARTEMAGDTAGEVVGGTRSRGAYILAEKVTQTPETVERAATRLARSIRGEGLRLSRVAVEGNRTIGALRVDLQAHGVPMGRMMDVAVSIEVVPDLAVARALDDVTSAHDKEAGHAQVRVIGDAQTGWKLEIKIDGRLATESDVQHNLRHELREGAGTIADLIRDPTFDVEAAQQPGVFGPGNETVLTRHARAAALEVRDLVEELQPALQGHEEASRQVALARGGRSARVRRAAGNIAMLRLDAALDSMGFADPATRAAKTQALLDYLGVTADSPVGQYVEGYGRRYEAAVRRRAALHRVSATDLQALEKALGPDLEVYFAQQIPDAAIDSLNEMTKLGAGPEARALVREHAGGELNDEKLVSSLKEAVVNARRVSQALEEARASLASATEKVREAYNKYGSKQRWAQRLASDLSETTGEVARDAARKELAQAKAEKAALEAEANEREAERRPLEREVKRLERELRGGRPEYEGIGATGPIGEEFLRSLGGQSQVRKYVGDSVRIVDQLVDDWAHEAKVGETDLDEENERRIAREVELMGGPLVNGKRKWPPQIKGSIWHFIRSPVTGKIGPNARLAEALTNAGIEIRYEYHVVPW